MPSMKKVKDGYEVYNKNTKKTKLVKTKKQAEKIVKKGYKKEELDYGSKLFDVNSWKP